jgi:hypothetical protein
LCILVSEVHQVTVTSGMVSREDLDDLLREFYLDDPEAPLLLTMFTLFTVKMIHYIPTKTILELVQVLFCVNFTASQRSLLTACLRNKCKLIPNASEMWRQSFKILSMMSVYLRIHFLQLTRLTPCYSQHALFSHHDRGTSSSPFDPKNVHNSHSHEVIRMICPRVA